MSTRILLANSLSRRRHHQQLNYISFSHFNSTAAASYSGIASCSARRKKTAEAGVRLLHSSSLSKSTTARSTLSGSSAQGRYPIYSNAKEPEYAAQTWNQDSNEMNPIYQTSTDQSLYVDKEAQSKKDALALSLLDLLDSIDADRAPELAANLKELLQHPNAVTLAASFGAPTLQHLLKVLPSHSQQLVPFPPSLSISLLLNIRRLVATSVVQVLSSADPTGAQTNAALEFIRSDASRVEHALPGELVDTYLIFNKASPETILELLRLGGWPGWHHLAQVLDSFTSDSSSTTSPSSDRLEFHAKVAEAYVDGSNQFVPVMGVPAFDQMHSKKVLLAMVTSFIPRIPKSLQSQILDTTMRDLTKLDQSTKNFKTLNDLYANITTNFRPEFQCVILANTLEGLLNSSSLSFSILLPYSVMFTDLLMHYKIPQASPKRHIIRRLLYHLVRGYSPTQTPATPHQTLRVIAEHARKLDSVQLASLVMDAFHKDKTAYISQLARACLHPSHRAYTRHVALTPQARDAVHLMLIPKHTLNSLVALQAAVQTSLGLMRELNWRPSSKVAVGLASTVVECGDESLVSQWVDATRHDSVRVVGHAALGKRRMADPEWQKSYLKDVESIIESVESLAKTEEELRFLAVLKLGYYLKRGGLMDEMHQFWLHLLMLVNNPQQQQQEQQKHQQDSDVSSTTLSGSPWLRDQLKSGSLDASLLIDWLQSLAERSPESKSIIKHFIKYHIPSPPESPEDASLPAKLESLMETLGLDDFNSDTPKVQQQGHQREPRTYDNDFFKTMVSSAIVANNFTKPIEYLRNVDLSDAKYPQVPFNQLLAPLVERNKSDLVAQVLAIMVERKIEKDIATMTLLVGEFAKKKDWNGARAFLDENVDLTDIAGGGGDGENVALESSNADNNKKKVKPDIGLFRAIIKAGADAGDPYFTESWYDLLQIFIKNAAPTQTIHMPHDVQVNRIRSLIGTQYGGDSAAVDTRSIELAQSILDTLDNTRLQPQGRMYATSPQGLIAPYLYMMRALSRNKQPERVVQLFELCMRQPEFVNGRFTPMPILHQTYMGALCEAGDTVTAVAHLHMLLRQQESSVVKDKFRPDVMIPFLERASTRVEEEAHLRAVRVLSPGANVTDLLQLALLVGRLRRKDLKGAEEWWYNQFNAQVHKIPNVLVMQETLISRIVAACGELDNDQMIHAMQWMQRCFGVYDSLKGSATIWTELIKVVLAHSPETVPDVISKMKGLGGEANEVTFLTILTHHAKQGEYDTVCKILEDMAGNGVTVTTRHLTTKLVAATYASKPPAMIDSIFNEIIESPEPNTKRAIEAQLWKLPSAATSTYLDSFKLRKDYEGLMRAWDRLLSYNSPRPDKPRMHIATNICNSYLEALCACGHGEQAEEFFKLMGQSGGEWEMSVPSRKTLVNLVSGLKHCGDGDRARRVKEWAKQAWPRLHSSAVKELSTLLK